MHCPTASRRLPPSYCAQLQPARCSPASGEQPASQTASQCLHAPAPASPPACQLQWHWMAGTPRSCFVCCCVLVVVLVAQAASPCIACCTGVYMYAHRCLYEIWQTVVDKGGSGLLVLSSGVEGESLKTIMHQLDVAQVQKAGWRVGQRWVALRQGGHAGRGAGWWAGLTGGKRASCMPAGLGAVHEAVACLHCASCGRHPRHARMHVQAQATVEEDRVKILGAISRSMGWVGGRVPCKAEPQGACAGLR